MLQETINKLNAKLTKARKKLHAYVIRLDELKQEGKKPSTPSPRTLGRKYFSCDSYLDMYLQDVSDAKKQLALYESADFNAIRQTIKEQTKSFKEMFITEMVDHAEFIVRLNREILSCYNRKGKYSPEEMEGMTIKPSPWLKFNMDEEKVLPAKPTSNKYAEENKQEWEDYKELLHNAWTQTKRESEFAKVRSAGRYDLQKWALDMKSWKLDLEKAKEEQKKLAIWHFSGSLTKLAFRIMEHGLNWDNLAIESAHVGTNLNCTITDGERKLEAFTILAYGPIVMPHYRFLIKERKL